MSQETRPPLLETHVVTHETAVVAEQLPDGAVTAGGDDERAPRRDDPLGETDDVIGRDRLYEFAQVAQVLLQDRKSTRLNSSHVAISYAVFCLKKKKKNHRRQCASNKQ